MENTQGELSYFLTLFKIKGHRTFRSALHKHPTSFEKGVVQSGSEINEKIIYKVNRLTGEITK